MNTHDKMTEQELADLKARNAMLRAQNADLKDFLKHMNDELTSFLQYNAIRKEL